eukprot:CAMPEP_0198232428 /NCGR_PEP_ID=MMETSP1445-20131203/115727_1 /TAXON_ID=36898 /ORGANISM="Pyramimonas sp., Strain CCMP2087" /LENGTH=267 /DNA_ID=CAMNT_0043913105 /DNA_START=288 /DNA_END=1089 /DNA_ORIENTATION=-
MSRSWFSRAFGGGGSASSTLTKADAEREENKTQKQSGDGSSAKSFKGTSKGNEVVVKAEVAALEDAALHVLPGDDRLLLLTTLCSALGSQTDDDSSDDKTSAKNFSELARGEGAHVGEQGVTAVNSLVIELGKFGFLEAVVKGSTLEHLAANTITNEPNAAEQAKLRLLFGTCFCLDEKVLYTLMTQLQALATAQQEHKVEVVLQKAELPRAAGEALSIFKHNCELESLEGSISQMETMKEEMAEVSAPEACSPEELKKLPMNKLAE